MKQFKILISHPDFKRLLILRTIGNFLILFSLFIVFRTLSQPISEEIRYYKNQIVGKVYVIGTKKQQKLVEQKYQAVQKKDLVAKVIDKKPVEVLVPADPNFSIIIPKIGANAKVIANVNAASELEYTAALKKGVAHAGGTSFPGEDSSIYLFAHSTDYFYNVGTYNAIFYLIYKLEIGDEISLIYKGVRYKYLVSEKKIVSANEVQYLTRKTDFEYLTLQTCWPLGTTFKRLLVFARPAKFQQSGAKSVKYQP